jgi:hypothetical protein
VKQDIGHPQILFQVRNQIGRQMEAHPLHVEKRQAVGVTV